MIQGLWFKVGNFLLDILFPRSAEVKKLEKMSGQDLLRELPSAPAPSDRRLRALFDYKDERVKTLVWEIKFRGNSILTGIAAEAMLADLGSARGESDSLLVLSVPMSGRRKRERGWNQSELLAKAMRQKDPSLKYALEVLKKVRHTKPQADLNRSERKQNLKGAFAVQDKKAVEGKDCLVVDDVLTTGATFEEISRVLKNAEARSIKCIALAH